MVSRIVCLTMLVAAVNAATFMGYLPQKPIELGELNFHLNEIIMDFLIYCDSFVCISFIYDI